LNANAAPDAFRAAVWRRLHEQDRALLAGIAAYRRHPHQRALAEPPVFWREGAARVLDYGRPSDPPVLFIPSLVNRAHVLDLDEGASLMRWLAGQGLRPLLLDWGWPGPDERRFTLTDHIAGRLDRALAAIPGPVALVGYCMGGLLALAAAQRRPEKLSGLALLATPWDFHAQGAAQARGLAACLPGFEPMLQAHGALSVDAFGWRLSFRPQPFWKNFLANSKSRDPKSRADQRPKKLLVASHHPVNGEFFIDGPFSRIAQAFPKGLITTETINGFHKCVRIPRRHKQAIDAVLQDLRDAAHIGRDARNSRRHGLNQDQPKTFPERGNQKKVEGLHECRNIITKP